MKKPLLIMAVVVAIIVLILLLICFFAEYKSRKNKDTDHIDGGVVRNYSDPNAPKKIVSAKITDFECYFSTVSDTEKTSISGMTFTLSAKLYGDTVKGEYICKSRDKEKEKHTFEADRSFMEELYSIVAKYDLAQYNGYYYSVSGLPDDFGSNLRIVFESGEMICANDNQTSFLSQEAECSVEALFARYAGVKRGEETLWQCITVSRTCQVAGKCFFIDVFADDGDVMTTQGYCFSHDGKRCEAEEPFTLSKNAVLALRALELEKLPRKKKGIDLGFEVKDKEKRQLVLYSRNGEETEREFSDQTLLKVLEILVPEFCEKCL